MRTATPVNFTLDLNGRSGPRSSQVARALIDAIARGQVHDERDWTRAMRLAASPTRPPADLRDELTGHLRRARGLAVDPEDIFLFPSVSNALRAVTVTCGLTGQPVAFEDPGYAKARLALSQAGAVIRPVPVDDDGIRADDLRDSDRACYVTPAHQFPLGGRMPVRRRTDLLAWAKAAGALVLEDDYDGEFRYDVPPLNPLRSMPAAAAARLADAGLACLPLSPFCAGPVRRSGLLCGYSRLPETMADGAAALIGQVTAGLMAAG